MKGGLRISLSGRQGRVQGRSVDPVVTYVACGVVEKSRGFPRGRFE